MNIVKDLRVLKAMRKQGVKFCDQTGEKIHGLYDKRLFTCYYVDEAPSQFIYKGKKYGQKYFDGCFMPYIIELE